MVLEPKFSNALPGITYGTLISYNKNVQTMISPCVGEYKEYKSEVHIIMKQYYILKNGDQITKDGRPWNFVGTVLLISNPPVVKLPVKIK